MAKQTDLNLRSKTFYQVFPRQHSQKQNFKGIIEDLDRIKNMGVDIVYLLPIHEIGQLKKKGSLGCPYSIKDYRSINHVYGTLNDFKDLVSEVHRRDMRLMIDVVYNHTSHDSVLINEHPEYFYKNDEGEFANRVGDWWDITDLDYNNSQDLWEELIDTLLYWTSLGVDDYRFDVASLLPLEFLEEAHERILDVNPSTIFLSESVHGGFVHFLRNQGYKALSENEIYQVFDMAYDYDTHPYFEAYLKGELPFKRYAEELKRQEEIYPDNYVKMRNLENHDYGRFSPMVNNDIDKINNWTALSFFSKGATMVYAGQERLDKNRPDLFEIDKVNWNGPNITPLITKLAEITKDKSFSYGFYNIRTLDIDVFVGEYYYLGKQIVGIFNVGLETGELNLEIKDGHYVNLIDNSDIIVKNGKFELSHKPIIFFIFP
jgi:cyclomaltodextrinase